MKFTIETKVLSDALRIASVAVMGGRSTLPILGNIKIEAKKDQITLSTTNLDIYVQQKLPAKVSKEGATTAPFTILLQLVGRMQSSTISIEQQKGAIEFKSGEVVAELETLDAAEFPDPLPRSGEGVECDAQDILKPFSMIVHSIGVDSYRYMLMGVNVIPTGEFAASDGRRVAFYAGKEITTESVILPDVFVRAVLKIQPEGPITIFVGGGCVSLISNEIDICAKLIEATFPNWKESVPKQSDKAFACGRKQLIAALQTCAIFASFASPKTPGLNITGRKKEVEVSQPGKASAMVLGTELTEQPEITIKLNEAFLIDALSVLESDQVRIQVNGKTTALLIEEGNFKEVIMPMRTE